MIQVGIIGGAGYTAGELIRLLVNHPETTIDFGDFNFQNSNAKIYSVLGQLVAEIPLNQKSSMINTSSLESGIYLVTITAGDSSVTKRLIKQ